jgi:hypothetical protein
MFFFFHSVRECCTDTAPNAPNAVLIRVVGHWQAPATATVVGARKAVVEETPQPEDPGTRLSDIVAKLYTECGVAREATTDDADLDENEDHDQCHGIPVHYSSEWLVGKLPPAAEDPGTRLSNIVAKLYTECGVAREATTDDADLDHRKMKTQQLSCADARRARRQPSSTNAGRARRLAYICIYI